VFRDFAREPSIAKKALMRKDLLELHFPKYFTKFAELLDSSDGDWIAGNTLTYADLALANFFDVAEDMVNPDCLKEYPSLQKLKDDVFAIPQVQDWITFSRGNVNKTAAYGSGG
jgi:glutathione S-transferase